MGASGSKSSRHLADWMKDLGDGRDRPLHMLSIPGSHNSGTFHLDGSKGIAADQPDGLRRWMSLASCFFCCLFTNVVKKWGRCQDLDIHQQLEAGVRYLDMRVASRSACCEGGKGDKLHCIHGLHGPEIRKCMEDVKRFLDQHDREVVLIDFNHLYDMDEGNFHDLARSLQQVFGDLLCSPDFYFGKRQDVGQQLLFNSLEGESENSNHFPSPASVAEPREFLSRPANQTLNKLCDGGKRVIVFLDIVGENGEDSGISSNFWPRSFIDSERSWANEMDVERWKSTQEWASSLRGRTGALFYVSQGILTPNGEVIRQNCCLTFWCCCCSHGSIETECAEKIRPALMEWVEKQSSLALHSSMIYTADFVDEGFIQAVVDQNNFVNKKEE